MKRLLILLVFIPTFCYAQQEYLKDNNNGPIIRTSIVMQNWKVDGVEYRIAEGTFPIDITIPIREDINLQISHSPAISRFGDIDLSGLSDTWIRSSYTFYDEKMMISGGIGLPTGKTELTSDETMLMSILSQNAFKFRLPVFGQGFTISGGVILAYPFNEQIVIGGGVNFVLQGKYKYAQYDFDPGDQIGCNIGFDYNYSSNTKFSFDFLYNYYTKDKIDKIEHNSDPKIGAKANFYYRKENKLLWIVGRYRHNGKSETMYGTTLIADSTNSNIKQLELEGIFRIGLSQILSFDILFEGRSYIENEYKKGQADIFGGGLRNNIQLTPKLQINLLFKQFIGDGYFINNDLMPKFSGREFQLGTIIRL